MNASTGESMTSLALFANLRRSFDVLLLSRSGNLYDWKFVLAIFTELIILLNHWCTKWERTVFFNDPFWKGHMVTIELWPSSDHLEGGQVVMVNEVSYCLRHDVSRWAGAGKHLEIFTDSQNENVYYANLALGQFSVCGGVWDQGEAHGEGGQGQGEGDAAEGGAQHPDQGVGPVLHVLHLYQPLGVLHCPNRLDKKCW